MLGPEYTAERRRVTEEVVVFADGCRGRIETGDGGIVGVGRFDSPGIIDDAERLQVTGV
jgi:hypothetical protein